MKGESLVNFATKDFDLLYLRPSTRERSIEEYRLPTPPSAVRVQFRELKRKEKPKILKKPKRRQSSFSRKYLKEQENIRKEYERVLKRRKKRREHMINVQRMCASQRIEMRKRENEGEDQFKKKVEKKVNMNALSSSEREEIHVKSFQKDISNHLAISNYESTWAKYSGDQVSRFEDKYEEWEKRSISDFRKRDRLNKASISHDQLADALRYFYYRLHSDEIQELLNQRVDKTAPVDLEEFLYILRLKVEEIEELFRSIDTKNDGVIDVEELQFYLNGQPDLYSLNAQDIIFHQANSVSNVLTMKNFKLMYGLGTKEDYEKFDQDQKNHQKLSEYFLGKDIKSKERNPERKIWKPRDFSKKLFCLTRTDLTAWPQHQFSSGRIVKSERDAFFKTHARPTIKRPQTAPVKRRVRPKSRVGTAP